MTNAQELRKLSSAKRLNIKHVRTVLEDVESLIDEIREAWDDANNALDVCEEHKESPRDYETDEKQDAREEAAEALMLVADLIDALGVDNTKETSS